MAKKRVRYSLKIVNNGKPFKISNWTVEKHEDALSELTKNEKGKTTKQLDGLFRYYVILQTLQEIDENVTIEQVKGIHVENIVELFNVIYNAGKVDIVFRKGENPK